jgi:hypothetical protein
MEREEAVNKCICSMCPSYFDCGELLAFCLAGKSKCIRNESGCICPGCPVQGQMQFNDSFYCTRGSAKLAG